jgi:hypothetical protein
MSTPSGVTTVLRFGAVIPYRSVSISDRGTPPPTGIAQRPLRVRELY